MSESKPNTTMEWTDSRGQAQVRAINHIVDIRDFKATAMYPWLFIAANTHLSIRDLQAYLRVVGEDFPRVKRSLSWIYRKRWMAQPPDTANPINRPNRDGNDAQALRIMADNPDRSLRQLVYLLQERGIRRGKDWICKNRGITA